MTEQRALDVEHLTTSLLLDGTRVPVVRDVSFHVGQGEILGLVGESGSGKSMTARTIMRLLPDGAEFSGRVLLGGEDVPGAGRALRAVRARRMSMIFQDPRSHVDPLYRCGEHLLEGLRLTRDSPRAELRREALALLRRVGITDAERVFEAYPSQVSGGMLQRVMIAGALTGEPELLIADEPTTALDVTTQAEIAALLDALRRRTGCGILFITHNLDLAAAICDRTIVMYAGQLMEEHATRRLFETPLHPYTARLLCARPRLDARIDRLEVIQGRPVSAFEAPDGCPFRSRCPYATDVCAGGQVQLRPVDAEGQSACRRIDDLAEVLHGEVLGV